MKTLPPPQVNLQEASLGQLSPRKKEALMEILNDYADVFAVNSRAVAVRRGSPMRLKLKDSNSVPYVTLMRHYTPEQSKIFKPRWEKYATRDHLFPRRARTRPAATQYARV